MGNMTRGNEGLIPRALDLLFTSLRLAGIKYAVTLSYVHVYAEKIQDLLNRNAEVRLDTKKGARQEACKKPVTDQPQCLKLLELGNRSRPVASTMMNAASSRSHSCVTLTVTQDRLDKTTQCKLVLVDLAGSERISDGEQSLLKLSETASINRSLFSLGVVVQALAVRPDGHIPYGDSKLTQLLRDCIGGKCRTSLLVTVSPAVSNAHETINSLAFGQRALKIAVSAQVNMKDRQKEDLAAIKAQMAELRRQLECKDEEMFSLQRRYELLMEQQLKISTPEHEPPMLPETPRYVPMRAGIRSTADVSVWVDTRSESVDMSVCTDAPGGDDSMWITSADDMDGAVLEAQRELALITAANKAFSSEMSIRDEQIILLHTKLAAAQYASAELEAELAAVKSEHAKDMAVCDKQLDLLQTKLDAAVLAKAELEAAMESVRIQHERAVERMLADVAGDLQHRDEQIAVMKCDLRDRDELCADLDATIQQQRKRIEALQSELQQQCQREEQLLLELQQHVHSANADREIMSSITQFVGCEGAAVIQGIQAQLESLQHKHAEQTAALEQSHQQALSDVKHRLEAREGEIAQLHQTHERALEALQRELRSAQIAMANAQVAAVTEVELRHMEHVAELRAEIDAMNQHHAMQLQAHDEAFRTEMARDVEAQMQRLRDEHNEQMRLKDSQNNEVLKTVRKEYATLSTATYGAIYPGSHKRTSQRTPQSSLNTWHRLMKIIRGCVIKMLPDGSLEDRVQPQVKVAWNSKREEFAFYYGRIAAVVAEHARDMLLFKQQPRFWTAQSVPFALLDTLSPSDVNYVHNTLRHLVLLFDGMADPERLSLPLDIWYNVQHIFHLAEMCEKRQQQRLRTVYCRE
eukprot:TRINITY_DN3122_c0_g1_i1.p1 TRINITY_DN3122_c0_g1~~TRINITY_DN3122_c0_g1_i1.p1  ORF type:complete len:866 (-),score=207.53 TRINITY_DN3122_c0_g1_i1:2555-5152(-)